MSDGNLRAIFQSNLPAVHWQAIESWSTGQGVPDANGCFHGAEFWVENKKTSANRLDHNFTAEQIGWIERRLRAGGRVFAAVRKSHPGGPRRGAACDELWLFHGSAVRALASGGLAASGAVPLGMWPGGPRRWDWKAVLAILINKSLTK